MTEGQVPNPERRSFLKKLGILAAGVTALMSPSIVKAASGRTSEGVVSSKELAAPTVADYSELPSSPIAGQKVFITNAGCEAIWNSIGNRWDFPTRMSNDGSTHVTPKGIINGLSVLPNDGISNGFGPDTKLNATAPGQYGSSGNYTENYGASEAWNYSITSAISGNTVYTSQYFMIPIKLLAGVHIWADKVTVSPSKAILNPKMTGEGSLSTVIYWNFNDNAIEFDHTSANLKQMSVEFSDFGIAGGSNVGSSYGFFAANFVPGDAGYQNNEFQSYNILGVNDFNGTALFNLTGWQDIYLYNPQAYNGGVYGFLYAVNVYDVYISGCYLGNGMYLDTVTTAYINSTRPLSGITVNNVSTLILPYFEIHDGIVMNGNVTDIWIDELSAYETGSSGASALLNYNASGTIGVTSLHVGRFYGKYAQTYKASNSPNLLISAIDLGFVSLASGASLDSTWYNSVTAPAVGTYTNTNQFSIRILILASSSATYTITLAQGGTTSSASAVAGSIIILGPGETITPSGTLTWQFLPGVKG